MSGQFHPGDHVTYLGDRAKFVQYYPDNRAVVQFAPGGLTVADVASLVSGWPEDLQHFLLKVQTIDGAWVPLGGEHRLYTAVDAVDAALLAVRRHEAMAVRVYDTHATDDSYAAEITGRSLASLR